VTTNYTQPGVYGNVTSEQYHLLPFCSNSRLTLLKRSAAHLRAHLDNPGEPTDAMRLGTAIHTAVLERDEFEKRYTEAGQCEALVKSGDRKGEQCANAGVALVGGAWGCGIRGHLPEGTRDTTTVLTRADFLTSFGVQDAVHMHPRIGKLFAGEGANELTVIWDDPETGVRCKARIDRLVKRDGRTVLVDLKTCTDAREEAFRRKMYDLGYYRQLAMYSDALRITQGVTVDHMVIVAAEKEAPFALMGHRLSEATADEGRRELSALLRRYAECERTNRWPAYPDTITELTLPDWAWGRELEEAA
jgi:hypothetical protein